MGISRAATLLGASMLLPAAAKAKLPAPPKPDYQSPEVTPWPKPQVVTNGSGWLLLTGASHQQSLWTVTTTCKSHLLQMAWGGTLLPDDGWLLPQPQATPTSPLPHSAIPADILILPAMPLQLNVMNDSEVLSVDTDESYTLDITAEGNATIEAASVFGALHAMRTLKQLFELAPGECPNVNADCNLTVRGLPWHIKDFPRFSHRAMLVDTSRHFLPIELLKKHVSAMASQKLNVLHWHLVDFQAFPFESSAMPKLAQGAYSQRERYRTSDVAELVDFATSRGVRVMMEIDTPGHSTSWGAGYPQVVAACPKAIAASAGVGALDPSSPMTFQVVEALLQEVGKLAPDSYFHLGGDEVRFGCWKESDKVRKFMIQQGFGCCADENFAQLEQYYENRLLEIAERVLPGRTLVVYQEVYDNNVSLPAKVAFDVWKAGGDMAGGHDTASVPAEVAKIIKAGHKAILANGNDRNWYLWCCEHLP
jgi:hexosaminidase